MPTKASTEATAYHEAGHAVIAHALGCKVSPATIIPTIDEHGHVIHANPLRGLQRLDIDISDRARLRAEKAISICFAGPLAQQQFRPRSWRRHHAQSDYGQIIDLAQRLCGSDEEVTAFVRWRELVARDMVRQHWPAIERVASLLLERQQAGADEIVTAIRAAYG
jgi:ATP-dependent Zn protease